MDTSRQEITTLVGRSVYSNNGVYVGEVEDLRLDIEGRSVTGLALTDANADLFPEEVAGAHGVILPYRWVRSVGDVVLVADLVERIAESDDEEEIVA